MGMNLRKEVIYTELAEQLKEGKGCVIFDLGCYFPYCNPEDLIFDFQIDSEQFDDIKKNHRYPNKLYTTLSKKSGRNVSKIGYPYFLDLTGDKEKQLIKLSIRIGTGSDVYTYIFPLQISLSSEYPVCSLEFHYNMKDSSFLFCTYESIEGEQGTWYPTYWTNDEKTNMTPCKVIMLPMPTVIDDKTRMYQTNIVIPAETMDTVMITHY